MNSVNNFDEITISPLATVAIGQYTSAPLSRFNVIRMKARLEASSVINI